MEICSYRLTEIKENIEKSNKTIEKLKKEIAIYQEIINKEEENIRKKEEEKREEIENIKEELKEASELEKSFKVKELREQAHKLYIINITQYNKEKLCKKIVERKNREHILRLPCDLLNNITENYLNLEDRYNLQNSCKTLRFRMKQNNIIQKYKNPKKMLKILTDNILNDEIKLNSIKSTIKSIVELRGILYSNINKTTDKRYSEYKKNVIEIIKKLLRKTEEEDNKYSKTIYGDAIMYFVVNCKFFLKIQKVFRKTVLSKLDEFENTETDNIMKDFHKNIKSYKVIVMKIEDEDGDEE